MSLGEEVKKTLRAYADKHYGLPSIMPTEIEQAAAWWFKHTEAASESMQLANLRKFLSLSDEDHRVIRAGFEDNFPWRGDDMAVYRRMLDDWYEFAGQDKAVQVIKSARIGR